MKKASEPEPEKRGPSKGLFYAASSTGVPWASYSIHPWLLYEPFIPIPCPSSNTDCHFSCKAGILSLESFFQGHLYFIFYILEAFPTFYKKLNPAKDVYHDFYRSIQGRL